LVDLVICAESFFLGDVEATTELKFRSATRAAKFIARSSHSQQEIFKLVQEAYDVRSKIVHTGAEPSQIRLPNGQKVTLLEFNDLFEHLMRLALVQATEMDAGSADLRTPQYWNRLLFS
jgi:hypothetical protein